MVVPGKGRVLGQFFYAHGKHVFFGNHATVVRRVARDPDTVRPLIRLVNRVRRRPETDGDERIRGFLEQLRAARLRPGHGVAAALFALSNWFLDAICLWICFRAMGVTRAGRNCTYLSVRTTSGGHGRSTCRRASPRG